VVLFRVGAKGGHTVLFLSLCHVDSKERHWATRHNRDSTEGKAGDILLQTEYTDMKFWYHLAIECFTKYILYMI